jgi:hypothetical protein
MQETSSPPDPGFVVEWQLADAVGVVIDLSAAESEVFLPDDATSRASLAISPLR